ncbi:MAG TPA: tetratricopeptide repeat protein [Nitrospiria bacterium]|nr:tetratricopeptide repeat protein [Nitrospiria bacterium]
MGRLQTFLGVLVLPVVIGGLAGCGSKFSSTDPAVVPLSAAPSQQRVSSLPTQAAGTPSPSRRDPLMEQGAHFMSVVMEYKRRLEKNPKDKEALLFLGNANYDINRFDQAKDYYKRYLDIDPTNAGVRTDLATSYYNVKDVDSALRELKSVLSQVPDHEAALYNVGLILWKDKQDKPGAINAWETLLKTHPNYPKAAEVRKQMDEIKKS